MRHLDEPSANQLQTLLDNSPAIFWLTDADGKCTYLSKQWYELTGRTPEQELGFGWLESVHPDDRAEASDVFLTANKQQEPFRLYYRLRRYDGSYRWSLDAGSPRFGKNGEFQGYFGNVIDTHDQHRLEERFRGVANAVDLGIWYCDLPFADLIWDESVKRHFWVEPGSSVTIETFYERIHPEDREKTRAAIESSIDSRGPYDIVYRTTNPADGRQVKWIRAIGWTDYDASGKPIRFDGVTIDVTEERRTQEELRNAVRIRDEFLSLASHELKTPLTTILLQTQAVQRKMGKGDFTGLSADRLASLMAQVSRQADRLNRLVDDMLDISRITTGKLTISREDLPLGGLVTEAAEPFRAQFTALGTSLSINAQEEVMVSADRARLEQVVVNLLSNALKYGNKQPVEVDVFRRNGHAAIRVKDHGIGIAPENHSRIFRRFERAVNANSISGLGLGLYISREIVEMHGGSIQLESSPGAGSAFTVFIPN